MRKMAKNVWVHLEEKKVEKNKTAAQEKKPGKTGTLQEKEVRPQATKIGKFKIKREEPIP